MNLNVGDTIAFKAGEPGTPDYNYILGLIVKITSKYGTEITRLTDEESNECECDRYYQIHILIIGAPARPKQTRLPGAYADIGEASVYFNDEIFTEQICPYTVEINPLLTEEEQGAIKEMIVQQERSAVVLNNNILLLKKASCKEELEEVNAGARKLTLGEL